MDQAEGSRCVHDGLKPVEVHCGESKFLAFRLGKGRYCIQLKNAKEVADSQAITKLPGMAGHIKGIIVLRDKLVPVIDARVRLRVPIEDQEAKPYTIVVQRDGKRYAFMVDDVEEIVGIHDDRIQFLQDDKQIAKSCICGSADCGGVTLHILHVESIFKSEP